MKSKLTNENGITIIILTITIIIILILSGVTVRVAIENRGIINEAENASDMQINQTEQEKNEITNILKNK